MRGIKVQAQTPLSFAALHTFTVQKHDRHTRNLVTRIIFSPAPRLLSFLILRTRKIKEQSVRLTRINCVMDQRSQQPKCFVILRDDSNMKNTRGSNQGESLCEGQRHSERKSTHKDILL